MSWIQMAKTVYLKLFHLVLFSICFQSSALNMKLLSFLIKTYKLIRAFHKKKIARHFTYWVPRVVWVLSVCEFLQMENNILSGATYFGFSRMHHENRQEAWPWRIMRPLKQPGTQPGELIPDSSYHKDLVMLSLMIVLFFSLKFSVSIPQNSTFIPAPAKLNAYAKYKTFWPTLFKHARFFW